MQRSLRQSGVDSDQSVPAFAKKRSVGARQHVGGEPVSRLSTGAESGAAAAGFLPGAVMTG